MPINIGYRTEFTMKRKLIKGLEMLVMAGFLVTAVGSNAHATENQVNENTENLSLIHI